MTTGTYSYPQKSSWGSVGVQAAISILCAGIIAASLAGIAVALYELRYANRIYPGVSIYGVDVSGMTPVEAAAIVNETFDYPRNGQITFVYNDTNWTATPEELGARFDLDTTITEAFAHGRRGDLRSDLEAQWETWFNGHAIAPRMIYNDRATQEYVGDLADELYTPLIDASLTIDGLDVQVSESSSGRIVDVDATVSQVMSPVVGLQSASIPIVVDEYQPAIEDAERQAAIARQIIDEPLTIGISDPLPGDPSPWRFERDKLAQMLTIRQIQDGPGKVRYEVGLDDRQLRAFLVAIQGALEIKPQNPRFDWDSDIEDVVLVTGGVIGRELDVEKTVQVINEQLVAGAHSVPLQFNEVEPEIADNMTAEEMGITALVSEATTYFSGSSSTRIENVVAGARTMDGILIPPGAEFSFNEWVGDISLDNGFAEALIIFNGRTIKGVGGGVCQVSTTAFRAAFYGGYPIVERNSHAYRVSYYEQGPNSPGPGVDAAIYTPLVDFRFTNDRDSWLLIKTFVNVGARTLTYSFYSTDDGRTVEVKKPVIKNQEPPPQALYVENPDLAQGAIKQVDWAATGAEIFVDRIVSDGDGSVLMEDTIYTNYQPWQAVYEYGPGTSLPAGAQTESSSENQDGF